MALSRSLLSAFITRKHVRVEPLPGRPVEIQVMGAASLDILLARDISVGGVGVRVSHGFEGSDLSATLELIIKLPDRKAFMVKGVVRYTNAKLYLFGIEFVQLPERAQTDLTEYVRQMTALGRSRSA